MTTIIEADADGGSKGASMVSNIHLVYLNTASGSLSAEKELSETATSIIPPCGV